MRFIITASRGDTKAEADAPFDEKMFADYMRFNEALHKAGVLVASEGLNPAAKAARVGISSGKRVVLDGPFAESKELVGGFYLIEVASLDEAIKWAMRCPVGFGSDNVLEIRQLTGSQDIPPDLLEICADVAPGWTASFTAQGR